MTEEEVEKLEEAIYPALLDDSFSIPENEKKPTDITDVMVKMIGFYNKVVVTKYADAAAEAARLKASGQDYADAAAEAERRRVLWEAYKFEMIIVLKAGLV